MSNNHIFPLLQFSYDESLDEPTDPNIVSPLNAIDEEIIREGMERLSLLSSCEDSEEDIIKAIEFLSAISYLIENDMEDQSEDFHIIGKMLDVVLRQVYLEIRPLLDPPNQTEPYGV